MLMKHKSSFDILFSRLFRWQALPATQLSGTLPSAQLSGTYCGAVTLNNAANSFSGNGAALTGVNAATLNGFGYCALSCYWNLTGNAGMSPGVNFVGTTDNQPLTLRVNNTIALRLTPGTSLPNVVGGLAGFHPSVIGSGVSGAVIAGGNAASGGDSNLAGGQRAAVFDGYANQALAQLSFVGWGHAEHHPDQCQR